MNGNGLVIGDCLYTGLAGLGLELVGTLGLGLGLGLGLELGERRFVALVPHLVRESVCYHRTLRGGTNASACVRGNIRSTKWR